MMFLSDTHLSRSKLSFDDVFYFDPDNFDTTKVLILTQKKGCLI